MREGRDFTTPAELAVKLKPQSTRWLQRGLGEELAACVVAEMSWLEMSGYPPGGTGRDTQPAWRAELWQEYLYQMRLAEMSALPPVGL
ncbi:MAG: hypothetical protein J7M38_12170 [Armatimonadetes bacterium]|nr:hypothetical protein [Armatimonadota bacterium]